MRIGNQPILEALASLDETDRAQAHANLLCHEEQAALESTLNPGYSQLLQWLKTHKMPTALITRNSLTSVTTVLARHSLQFNLLVTREHGHFKPNPAPLLFACEKLNV